MSGTLTYTPNYPITGAYATSLIGSGPMAGSILPLNVMSVK
jgi:hypothetical protein